MADKDAEEGGYQKTLRQKNVWREVKRIMKDMKQSLVYKGQESEEKWGANRAYLGEREAVDIHVEEVSKGIIKKWTKSLQLNRIALKKGDHRQIA